MFCELVSAVIGRVEEVTYDGHQTLTDGYHDDAFSSASSSAQEL